MIDNSRALVCAGARVGVLYALTTIQIVYDLPAQNLLKYQWH